MLPAWLIIALALAALAALLARRRALAGSTLTAAWWWAVLGVLVAALAEGAIATLKPPGGVGWPTSLRYVAAAATLLPVMSVLGAKRPQHRAWQWIVASLWAVLLVPVVQSGLFSRGGPLEIHVAWRVFLAVLILMGLVNFCFTRFALPAVLVAAGQTALLWPQLPAVRATHGWPPVGWSLLAAAVVMWSLRVSDSPRCPDGSRCPPGLQRLWLIFRDHYGLMWALRVVERFNAAATMYDWPLRLSWEGFTSVRHDGPLPPLPPDVQQRVDTAFRSLLRRFLSSETIDRELSTGSQGHQTGHNADCPDSQPPAVPHKQQAAASSPSGNTSDPTTSSR